MNIVPGTLLMVQTINPGRIQAQMLDMRHKLHDIKSGTTVLVLSVEKCKESVTFTYFVNGQLFWNRMNAEHVEFHHNFDFKVL